MKKVLLFIAVIIIVYGLIQFFRWTAFPLIDGLIFSIQHHEKQIPTPTSQEECLRNNGEWRRPGPWPKEVCMMKYADGNKQCFAGFQCESGKCIAAIKNLRHPQVVSFGGCAVYRILFGCLQEVHFGITSGAVCLD